MYANQCYNTKNNLNFFKNIYTFLYFVLFYVLSLIYQITNKTKNYEHFINHLASINGSFINSFYI